MAPAPQGGGQGDNSASLLWGAAAVIAFLYIIWFVFKAKLVSFYLMIKLFEVNMLNFITGNRLEQLKGTILSALKNPDAVPGDVLVHIGNSVGDYLKFPFVILLVILAFVVYFGNSTRVFKRTYNMKDLITAERESWPHITPIIGLDLIKVDIDKGPWAMAMTPIQFCKKNNLLEEVRPQRREGMSRRDWDKIEVVLKRGEANRIFALQLGQVWRGPEKLPPHVKALFAVFAARINADSKGAANLLLQISASSKQKLNFNGTNELLKKHVNTKLVQEVMDSHAYVHTTMASMLERARDDGVQASADFLWLKPIDRRLWYTLNTVGRQTPFVEIAGIFAHWVAEKEAGRKLLVPMVEEATKALELALKEVVYKRDEA